MSNTTTTALARAPQQAHAGMDEARESDLEILEEVTLCELPRGQAGTRCVRLRFVRAKTTAGKELAWYDLRDFWQSRDGAWHLGRRKMTIQGHELRALSEAMAAAAASSPEQ